MSDVLSQDEVDSLFDDDAAPAPASDEGDGGVRPYDLAKQERIVRGLFVIEPTLVFGMVEILFGGDGKIHSRIEGRDFTVTEQRIIHKVLEIVIAEYEAAWAPAFKLKLEYVRSEMQPQFASIATPSEVVVATRFDMEIGHVQGALHICMPYASIEPIRDLLLSSTHADTGEPDHRWIGLLSRQVQTAEVDLVATLASREATLRQVLNLRSGDVVPIHLPDLIQAHVDGVPLFECRPGSLNGHYAIRVEQILKHSQDGKPIGGAHA